MPAAPQPGRPKTIVIAGCGDLGTETGLRFEAAGHRVVGIRRSADVLPPSFERQSVDLRTSCPVVPPETDVVVVALTAGERTASAYRATYLDGLRHVLDGVERAGATPRLLLVSSTAVYDVDDGSWVDEATEARATSPTATVLRETERELALRVPNSVILRLGGLYGPGRERLIDQVRAGDSRTPRGSLFTNRIHRDDAARSIVHLALHGAPPPLVVGVDDEPAQLGDVLTFLAEQLGLPAPAPSRGRDRPQGGDRRLSNALLRSTGFAFDHPTFREGYAAVLRGEGVRHP
ncbi:NAD(P)-dependent oxidoreductase [Frondihabitans sp. PAMC 28766]|uniref:NAD(P)-dependent oxidoreductase n=1 Tax=Frondihabitans sp. PAMC 28766 TaxID=1795630 RepID=UPI00078BE0A7|nr:NAD(P)-dependent oxidoreductase [Frondihabitans sp. PAMC 28766]AMM20268.1 NAD(P)-dependent oxidoreductase [Frondihabitans sp. PAMC 28766]